MIARRATDIERINELKSRLGAIARFDPLTCGLYSTDASNYQIKPLGVAYPRDADDLQFIVQTAGETGVPILARGAGTGLAGQTLGPGLIVDCARHLNRILEINAEERTALVEPGVVLALLNRAAESSGLMFGPDPASADRATIGGMIGNNATGAHSIRYGMTADHLLSAEVVLGDGSRALFRPQDAPSWESIRRGGTSSFEDRLYEGVADLVGRYQPAIRAGWPQTWRRASGYSLNYLISYSPSVPPAWDRDLGYPPTGGVNLTPLLCGSEGTLAVLSRARLRLVPRAKAHVLVLLAFDAVAEAAEATPEVLASQPDAVELIPREIFARARTIPAYARHMSFLEGDPAALVVIEYTGESDGEALDKARRLGKGRLIVDQATQQDLWTVRKAGLGLLMSVPGDVKPITFIEDVTVPVERLAEYVRRVNRILEEHRTYGEWYAHASAGCLHLRPLVNLKQLDGVEHMGVIARQVVELIDELGGVLSGEHGDGLSHTEFNERIFGPEIMAAFRELKGLFDPKGILNPGKVVPARDGFGGTGSITQNLRYGPAYHAEAPETVFAYQREGSFAQAIESCTGLGVCRKDEGLMCPSYKATRQEEDSTRGRANALRLAISGALPKGALQSAEMFAVMDLCLECKGCKAECPTAVDMARLKSEFLSLYFHEHRVPLRSRLFAEIHALSSLGSRIAQLVNWGAKLPLTRALGDRLLGISARRRLPSFAGKPFRRRWRPLSSANRRPEVVLFADTFLDYQNPEIGMAAVKVLRAAGYEVLLADGQVCCGRPMISKGLLQRAKTVAERNLAALAPYAERGVPIIGLEPSCLLTLRDEYLDFFPHDPRAEVIASHAYLIEEFLTKKDGSGEAPIERITFSPQAGAEVFLHNHCHSKALVGSEPGMEMLRMAGIRVEESGAGCCGMAGSFGYEREHYDLSMEIGEMDLFPKARHAIEEGMQLAAPGTSCRTQIRDGVGASARHPVEILAAQILEEAPEIAG